MQIVLAHEIRAVQDILGRPVTLLELDQSISLGTIGDRFALKRDIAEDELDPSDLQSLETVTHHLRPIRSTIRWT